MNEATMQILSCWATAPARLIVRRWLVAWLAMIFSTPGLVEAMPIGADGFTYYATLPGELNGQGTASGGWAGAWTANTAITEIVDPGTPLSFTPSGGTAINGGNRAAQINGNNDNAIARNFSATQTGDVYVSFLLRLSAGSWDDSDTAMLWFNAPSSTYPNIGIRGFNSGNEFVARWGTVTSGGGFTSVGGQLTTGSTYLIVGRLFKNASSNYNALSIWVNPAAGDQNSPQSTAPTAGTISSITGVGLRSVNFDAGDSLFIDQLTLGTTWADVVPVPEPSAITLALFSFSFLGLAIIWKASRT